MRLLVCGGRDFSDRESLFKAIDALVPWHEPDADGNTLPKGVTIISGGARGADRLAEDWAAINWTNLEVYNADWNAHGRAAGPVRNQRMLDVGKPDAVLAAPGGSGTADMVRRAEAAGIPVHRL